MKKALQGRLKTVQQSRLTVVVGYTQSYSIFVHENLEAHHPVGQAKFLEQPAREKQALLSGIVLQVLAKGKPLEDALLAAGFRLQLESQLLVPVDTGALKASAFTKVESKS